MSTLSNLYTGKRHALNYRLYRPEYPTQVVDFILNYIDERTTESRGGDNRALAVDCGCGSGQFTSLLSPHYGQVFGFDQSSSQIEQARQRWTLDNVTFRAAPAERLPLPTGSVDLITVAQAIHWFDQEPFYDECRRIAKPSGCFLAVIRPSKPWIEDPSGNGLTERLIEASDEMYDYIRPYMDPRAEKVVFDWENFRVPFNSTSDKTMIMTREFTLDQYIGYITSMSSYIKYLEAVPDGDLLKVYEEKLSDILRSEAERDPEHVLIHMKFRLDIIMAEI